MVAKPARRGLLYRLYMLFGRKPARPSARGNAVAFKLGNRAFRKSGGASPDLQRVVRMSMQSEARADH